MLILYAATRYDYGRKELGLSFEHYALYESLRALGHQIIYLDTLGVAQSRGRQEMNQLLLTLIRQYRPALLLTVMLGDELDEQVVGDISREGTTLTCNWFCDDHWRFEGYSKRWAPHFNYVVTTAHSALPKYRQIGYSNAIHSQWACNPAIHRRLVRETSIDVSFVGQPHGNRREVISALGSRGIEVRTYGRGWPSGRVSQDHMVQIFNESRINLNFANSIDPMSLSPTRLGQWALRWLPLHVLESTPFRGIVGTVGIVRRLLRSSVSTRSDADKPATFSEKQIKGRNFEIPGCGSLLLTERVDRLEEYYEPGREIVCFESVDELAEQIRYLLTREDKRRAIAEAGYRRTLAEHTYEHRFKRIFERMSLPLLGGSDDSATIEVFH